MDGHLWPSFWCLITSVVSQKEWLTKFCWRPPFFDRTMTCGFIFSYKRVVENTTTYTTLITTHLITFMGMLYQGSLYGQPKQCIVKGFSLKIAIFVLFDSPQKWVAHSSTTPQRVKAFSRVEPHSPKVKMCIPYHQWDQWYIYEYPSRIHGTNGIFKYTWRANLCKVNVGKYNIPMDRMGIDLPWKTKQEKCR